MTEKFRKLVAEPERAAKKLRELLGDVRPGEYVRKRTTINSSKKIANAKIAALQTLKWSAWLAAGGTQFLLWLARVTTMDNAALRKMEKHFSNMGSHNIGGTKRLAAFAQQYPNLSAHIVWLFALGMVGGGTYGAASSTARDDGAVVVTVNPVDALQYVSPDDSNFVTMALDEYFGNIAIGLTQLETYYDKPTRHRGETRHTAGPGLTWNYRYDANGKIRRRHNNGKTPVRSKQENYDQMKMHLAYETLPALRIALRGTKNINATQSVALVLAGYQRPSDMAQIAKCIDMATCRQDVIDAFQYTGNMPDNFWVGTMKRRWICAAYAVGALTTNNLMEMNRDVFSKMNIRRVYRDGKFIIDDATLEYVRGLQNDNSTVAEFLEDFDTGNQILAENDFGGKTIDYEIALSENINHAKAKGNAGLFGRASKRVRRRHAVQTAQLQDGPIAYEMQQQGK